MNLCKNLWGRYFILADDLFKAISYYLQHAIETHRYGPIFKLKIIRYDESSNQKILGVKLSDDAINVLVVNQKDSLEWICLEKDMIEYPYSLSGLDLLIWICDEIAANHTNPKYWVNTEAELIKIQMPKDLSIDGPFSPVSLKNFIEQRKQEALAENGAVLTVLVDNTSQGIALDDPHTLIMTPEDRIEQARYYRENLFDGTRIPAYLFRYLRYMVINADEEEYPTDQRVADAFLARKLTPESDEYKSVINLTKYSNHNVETAQIIGFVTLLSGTFNQAKSRTNISVY